LSGSGLVTTANLTINNAGTINPGSINAVGATGVTASEINIGGTTPLTLASTGTLAFDIGSATQANAANVANAYDFINMNGLLTLNGGFLSVNLVNNFTPGNLDTFTLLVDSGAISGSFSNVADGGTLVDANGTGSFTVTYGPAEPFTSNQIILSNFTAIVPEPGTVALMVLGFPFLLWVGWMRRSRKFTS
jgi:hypothetical protein